jgi:hypothetical protein
MRVTRISISRPLMTQPIKKKREMGVNHDSEGLDYAYKKFRKMRNLFINKKNRANSISLKSLERERYFAKVNKRNKMLEENLSQERGVTNLNTFHNDLTQENPHPYKAQPNPKHYISNKSHQRENGEN